jgi:hypothetical protein
MKRGFVLWMGITVFFTLAGASFAAQRGGGGRAGGMSGGMGGGSMGPGAPGMGRGGMDTRGPTGTDRGGRMPGMDRGRSDSTTMGSKSAGDLLTQNTNLSSRLTTLLPEGTNLQEAAQGFKNLGQFVAAVHVSKNLGVPFEDLKVKLTGLDSEKLGKAIHELKPDVNAKAEAKKANKQAKQDIKDSQSK